MSRDAATSPPRGPDDAAASAAPWPSRDALEDPNPLGSWLYRAIIRWGSLLVRTYYRVEMRGEPFPKDVPVLLVQNHSNGLADAHFPMVATRRPIRILVKYKLMRTPVIGWMLRRMAAIPMYRKKDGVDTRQNAASFEAVDRALQDGAVIVIFPEGESLDAIELRPLKSGVARMALSAQATADAPLGLRIVPIGVTYEDRDRFRSEASAVMGPAIDVTRIIEEAGDDQRGALITIMGRVRESLESLILHSKSQEEHDAAVALERILPTTDVPLGLRRKAAQTALRNDSGPGADERRDLTTKLGASLTAAGLTGDDVLGPKPSALAVFATILVCTPLAMLAAAVLGLPVALAVYVARYARSPDKKVTLRLLFSFAALMVWIPALTAVAWLAGGRDLGLVVLLLCLVSAYSFTGLVDAMKRATAGARRRALARSTADEEALRNAIRSIREAFPTDGAG